MVQRCTAAGHRSPPGMAKVLPETNLSPAKMDEKPSKTRKIYGTLLSNMKNYHEKISILWHPQLLFCSSCKFHRTFPARSPAGKELRASPWSGRGGSSSDPQLRATLARRAFQPEPLRRMCGYPMISSGFIKHGLEDGAVLSHFPSLKPPFAENFPAMFDDQRVCGCTSWTKPCGT